MSPPNLQMLKSWNRKLHIYVGLYLMVFLWLFALSGLLLNHAWQFTEFWNQRQRFSKEHAIELSNLTDDLAQARHLMRQLGLVGEIERTMRQPATDRFDFRVVRPGRIVEVKTDLRRHRAIVQETRVNGWGAMRMLHTFTGKPADAPRAERDWLLTRLWSLSMDAVALGLVVLVVSSVIMAYAGREKCLGASIALGLGTAVGAFFLVGLRWL